LLIPQTDTGVAISHVFGVLCSLAEEKMKSPYLRISLVALALLFAATPGFAQKKNKNQTPADATPPPAQDLKLPTSAADELDIDIGEMLAGLQVGKVEILHKYYADNAMFVSGSYGPPIVGFQTWADGYQRQRAQFSGMQIVRRNTVIFPHGDTAWATYQWEFSGVQTNGQPYSAKGQTTLIFNRVGSAWLIVHNHTSVDCDLVFSGSNAAPAPGAAAPPPTQPKQ
jgi:ketosteroid isomerase-like protein